MKVTPLFRRYLVFHMPIRNKIKGSSLYVANSKRGSYSRAEEVWIIEAGKECTYNLKPGDHCWLYDSFELTNCDINLWDEYKDYPEFEALKQLQIQFEGEIKTKLVFEDSILAVDPEYQIEPIVHGVTWTG